MINANEEERREISRMDRLRSASKERKKVLKFGILFEIHILPAKKYRKICDDSMIGMNIREFLELDDKKKNWPSFQNFSFSSSNSAKNCGGKLGGWEKEKKSGNVLSRDGQTLAFFSARPASPLETKEKKQAWISFRGLACVEFNTRLIVPGRTMAGGFVRSLRLRAVF